ncbi:MAG: type II toxin-antitoxin system mRNA interferase toxin, RelE/StbE family [Candidatus Paceibacterota bacterium]
MRVIYHKRFQKQYRKLPDNLREKFDHCLMIFIQDPFDQGLNNHALRGKYSGCRSIDITGDLRAIYEVSGENVNFTLIGTHSELYS